MSFAGDFADARHVADAVLYEGYILYPYRASAKKNQVRWQFGVLMPRSWSEADTSEPWASQTECLIESANDATLHVKARFLQVQQKVVEAATGDGFVPVESLEAAGVLHASFDESVEREADCVVAIEDLLSGAVTHALSFEAWRDEQPLISRDGSPSGRVVRELDPISGCIRISADPIEGPYNGLFKIRIRIENETAFSEIDATRNVALRASFVATHAFIAASSGAFISMLEPPEWAKPAIAGCDNVHTFPILIGEGRRDLVLSSPIILYDYPAIAPESEGDLFDATEIDEILLLRTLTLTDEEKREARATDPRAAAIIDRVETMGPEMFEKLHGTIREIRSMPTDSLPQDPSVPWWDPGSDASVSPETDHVVIAGAKVMRGSRVRLMPSPTGTDAQDIFLRGQPGVVEAVFFDVDGNVHIAATVEGDPAAELQRAQGRFLYFKPEEIEPLEVNA